MALVEHSIDDMKLATIVFGNSPQNRISPELCDDLERVIVEIGSSDARAVMLRSEGPDFCCGADVRPWPTWDRRELRTILERVMNTFNRFERLPIPTIAAVQGLCYGGGLELAIRADVIIAAHSARFGHSEQTIGIVTILGGIYRVAERAGRARAMEWALTSEQVSAAEMERFGVVNRVVEEDTLIQEATAFGHQIAQGPTKAHAAHKALLRTWAVGGVAAADEAMFDIAIPLWETEDVQTALPGAAQALRNSEPRPSFTFTGR